MKRILSWLLHHANRESKSFIFYSIKNRTLAKYGKSVGYDVQTIPGKKCWTCGGTGVYEGYYYESGERWLDNCNRCHNGWYKLPTYNVLERVQFGKYIFHQPKQRVYSEKNIEVPVTCKIEGYISHSPSKHGGFALTVLYLIYDFKGYWQRWYSGIGRGWACYWWLPRNYVNNIAHLIRYQRRAAVFERARKRRSQPASPIVEFEDLPF